ncbi:MAG TPA: TonB-dependent siderophore receptor, partial [Marinagarivorans sp.]
EHQFTLQLVKQTQLAGKDLAVVGGLIYVGERNGFFIDQDFMLPSYTTFRLAMNYQLSDSIKLRAQVNNLFDQEYYTNSYADVWVQPGTPRNARLSATVSF